MTLSMAVVAATATTAATVAHATVTYGPIIGRGHDSDETIIRWGTAEPSFTDLLVRPAGSGDFATYHGGEGLDHEVVLGGLAPSTLYDYVAVSGADAMSDTFTSCPRPGEPLTFVVYGDNRGGVAVHQGLVARITAEAPDLLIHVGDLVPSGARAEYLSEFFPVVGALMRQVPFMPAPGNHDLATSFPNGFGGVFALPRGSDGAKHTWYSFACGNALFIGLDSNDPGNGDQLDFLESTLLRARLDPRIQHVFPFFHHAPHSSSSFHGDAMNVRFAFSPLFEAPGSKVSVIFSGHDHVFERVVARGRTYVVTGGGGAPLYQLGDPTEGGTSQFFASAHHYVRVRLQGQALEAAAIDTQGTVLDTFRLSSEVPDPGPGPYPEPTDPGGGGGGCAIGPGGHAGDGAVGTSGLVGFAALVALVVLRHIRRRLTSRG